MSAKKEPERPPAYKELEEWLDAVTDALIAPGASLIDYIEVDRIRKARYRFWEALNKSKP